LLTACAGSGAAAESSAQAPSAAKLVKRLTAAGVPCSSRRVFAPRLLERDEIRCREFALATFSTTQRRARWTAGRSRESWFPAKFVAGDRLWAAWTSSADVARGIRAILGGRVLALQLPPPVPRVEKDCESHPAARPTPMSPAGTVYSYKREFWDTSETDTCTGLMVAAEAAPGTSGLTGVTESLDKGGPLSGVTMVLRSIHVDGVQDAPGSPILIQTITDREGGYAFLDIPVAASGSCYVLTVDAGPFGRFNYTGFFYETTFQQTLDMSFASGDDGDAGCFPSDLRTSARASR
jgi:hypothetical protein